MSGTYPEEEVHSLPGEDNLYRRRLAHTCWEGAYRNPEREGTASAWDSLRVHRSHLHDRRHNLLEGHCRMPCQHGSFGRRTWDTSVR